MYRITEKLPPLSWQQGASILTKCKTEKALLQNSRRCYDTNASRKSGIGKPILLVLGTAAAGIGGSIAYAKYDPKFRKTLDDYVPGSDSFIKFISQEEKSYVDNVKDGISHVSSSAVNKIYSLVGFGEKSEQSAIEPPPPLVVTKTVKSQPEPAPAPKKEPVTASKPEKEPIAKNSPKQAAKVEVEPTKKASQPPKEKPKQKPEKSEDFKKYDIPDLEKKAIDITEKAILAINSAVNELRTYREEVATLIEQSVQKDDINLWFKIKEKSEQKEKSIEKAEKIGKKAMKKIEHLALLISDEKTDIDETTRSKIENNIKNVLNDLIYTKAVFSKEKVDSSVTEKYAKKVEESRQALSKELGVLFPSLVVDTDVIISEEQLDLFVMYTCQLLNFYQKELQKLETIGKAKLEKIIEQSKAGNQDVNEDILELEKDLLKRNFTQELLKTELKLKLQFEDDLKSHLRRQAEVYKDHLDEVVYLKDQEAERKLKHSIDEKIEQMQLNYNIQLAKIIGRMKGIDFALKERAMAEKQAKHSQLLWTACQALNAAIKEGTNTKPWEDQLKPLEKQVKAISRAAAEEDELVNVVVESIPKEALSRGVFNEVALRDRFLNVERLAIRLANLPAGFVSIPRMFLSYLQSFLLVNLSKTIPPEELADEPFDVSALNNYDILFRARYWLDRGDVLQTLKYMNLLKGASRAIASEWMNEARILLETQQAADVLLWHAVNSSLIYLENSS